MHTQKAAFTYYLTYWNRNTAIRSNLHTFGYISFR